MFSLSAAINNWKRGKRDIPKWVCYTLSELASIDLDISQSIISYHLPPAERIYPKYKGSYKLPIDVSTTLDETVMIILIKGTKNGSK